MVVRTQSSIDKFLVEKRLKENWGLQRLHKWLSQWDNFEVLDEQIRLAHILNVLDKANVAVSRNEVRNCFNKYYKKEYHGEKKSYLNWMYSSFGIKNRAIVNPKRSHRAISKAQEAHSTQKIDLMSESKANTPQSLKSQSSEVEKVPLDTKINKTEAEGRLNTSLPSAHNQK